jgi:hypothetical protein
LPRGTEETHKCFTHVQAMTWTHALPSAIHLTSSSVCIAV